MLTMRPEQVDAFRQHHLQKFEDEMVEHLKKFSPQHWRVIKEPDGRRAIKLGIERARAYGFTSRGPVRFYLELMLKFGSYFDTDPQYSWAREVLVDPEDIDQMVRANWLHDRLSLYEAITLGQGRKYLLAALLRLSHLRIEDFVKVDATAEDVAVKGLWEVYPEKCDYLKKTAIRAFVRHSFEVAGSCGLTTKKGALLSAALAFFVGHGFPNDPLYAWIEKRLGEQRRPEERDRTDEIYSKAMLYLNHALDMGS